MDSVLPDDRTRQAGFSSSDEEQLAYQALAIGRVEQLRWLAAERPGPATSGDADPVLRAHEARLLASGADVDARSRATDHVVTPLGRLRSAFGLSRLDVEILISAAAAERDVAYRQAYAALWPEQNLQPEVAFFVRLWSDHERPLAAVRARFAPEAPLVAGRLVELASPGHYLPDAPLLYRRVRVAERVLGFLDGQTLPPQQALEGARFHAVTREPSALSIDPTLVTQVIVATRRGELLPVIHGLQGVGKKTLALATAHALDRPLLAIDLEALPLELVHFRPRLDAFVREARMQGAVLLFEHAEAVDDVRREALGRELRRMLDTISLPRLLSALRPPRWLHGVPHVVFEIASPTPATQVALWHAQFPKTLRLADGLRFEDIVHRYALVPGAIEEACTELASLDEVYGRQGVVDEASLSIAVRARLQHRLGALAQPVTTRARFSDLILPEDVSARLQEILAFARHRERLLGELGFGEKLAYGRGLSALFSGPPGTGKTMAATLVAAELGLELYRIDLAQVVNKFVGETEKNIGRIFDEARHGQVVLLFDEADSLFAKRSEVKSAHDRYANLEVNYLLQRMENFDGVMILTTNAETAIDPAFRRRLRFRVRFPAPDEIERAALWRAAMPTALPMADDIDFDVIADRYALVGGSIKNAAVRAAAAALEKGSPVTQAILMQTAALEHEEMGFLAQTPPR